MRVLISRKWITSGALSIRNYVSILYSNEPVELHAPVKAPCQICGDHRLERALLSWQTITCESFRALTRMKLGRLERYSSPPLRNLS